MSTVNICLDVNNFNYAFRIETSLNLRGVFIDQMFNKLLSHRDLRPNVVK